MTNASYVRTTRRIVNFSLEPDAIDVRDVRIRKPYSDAHYCPVQLVEELREYTERGGTSDAEYIVKLSGPVVTGKGRYHATQHGDRKWTAAELTGQVRSYGNPEPFPEPFPEPLRRFLVGTEALRDWSR